MKDVAGSTVPTRRGARHASTFVAAERSAARLNPVAWAISSCSPCGRAAPGGPGFQATSPGLSEASDRRRRAAWRSVDPMKLLLSYLRPHWRLVLLALLLATVNQVFSLLDPLIFRHVIDEYATRFDQYTTGEFLRGVSLLLLAAVGRRLRVARGQELPGLLRQRRHPAARRAALLGRDPALARAALPALRGPAQRRDPRQAAEGAHRRREADRGRHQRRLPDARRRRLRGRLRLQRALADRARVLRHRAAARLALARCCRGGSRSSRRRSWPRRRRSPGRPRSRCATSSS